MAARKFQLRKATRQKVPLLMGLFGPSGSGKTFSALRLATGIQKVNGGKIAVIDTEAKRALHYADRFSFEHLEFGAPFSPLDYLGAIQHCVSDGASVVIIDSMSHEHEGPGGVLEMHDDELQRMAGDDSNKRNKMTFSAWAKPKAERRRLINTMMQLPCSYILCFRAKEKTKLLTKAERDDAREKSGGRYVDPVKAMGWMPIGDDQFVYEMTASALLLPSSGGVPTWDGREDGERSMIKLPGQFSRLLRDGKPFSEQHGESMAQWAAGSSGASGGELLERVSSASTVEELEALAIDIAASKASLSGDDHTSLREAYRNRHNSLTQKGAA